jgi:hypothetical protein
MAGQDMQLSAMQLFLVPIDGDCIPLRSNMFFSLCSYSKYVGILGLKSAGFGGKIVKFDK